FNPRSLREERYRERERKGGRGGGGGDERRKSPGHLLLQPAAGRQRGRAWPDAPLDGGAEVEGGRRSRCFIRVSRDSNVAKRDTRPRRREKSRRCLPTASSCGTRGHHRSVRVPVPKTGCRKR
ncbi:unnamed protein product, partial [Prorocentrum cordatum]